MRKYRRLRRKSNKKQMHLVIGITFALLFVFTAGYAAFGTNISIGAKGNVKDRVDLYVSSNGSDTTGVGSITKPYATIQKAYDKAPSTATIYIMDNITSLDTITMNKNKNIILTSYSTDGTIYSIIKHESSGQKRFLNIDNGQLTIENIIIDGNNISSRYSLIRIGSEMTISEGSIIKNAISNDTGGAIWNDENSKLNIQGGKIVNNIAYSHGGAIIASPNAEIIISSGEITNNLAKNSGGGIYLSYKSSCKINDGTISNNTAEHAGGGIAVVGTLTMTGGIISENTSGTAGGGVRIGIDESGNGGVFNLSGGSIIDNIATNSPGISNSSIYNVSGSPYCRNGQTNLNSSCRFTT